MRRCNFDLRTVLNPPTQQSSVHVEQSSVGTSNWKLGMFGTGVFPWLLSSHSDMFNLCCIIDLNASSLTVPILLERESVGMSDIELPLSSFTPGFVPDASCAFRSCGMSGAEFVFFSDGETLWSLFTAPSSGLLRPVRNQRLLAAKPCLD